MRKKTPLLNATKCPKHLKEAAANRLRQRDGAPCGLPHERLKTGKCPACGGVLLAGKKYEEGTEAACDLCHLEFLIAPAADGQGFELVEHCGRLSIERALTFGIKKKEWAEQTRLRRRHGL